MVQAASATRTAMQCGHGDARCTGAQDKEARLSASAAIPPRVGICASGPLREASPRQRVFKTSLSPGLLFYRWGNPLLNQSHLYLYNRI